MAATETKQYSGYWNIDSKPNVVHGYSRRMEGNSSANESKTSREQKTTKVYTMLSKYYSLNYMKDCKQGS
jgi:IS1 family transposase